MAQIRKHEVKVELKSSPDKFYGFFRNNMDQLANILPGYLKSVQVLEGDGYSVGSVKLMEYILTGITMTVKVKIEKIDDGNKSITFSALDGEIMKIYKSFKSTVHVIKENGGVSYAKWAIEFEIASGEVPKPEIYGEFAANISKFLDAYLSKN